MEPSSTLNRDSINTCSSKQVNDPGNKRVSVKKLPRNRIVHTNNNETEHENLPLANHCDNNKLTLKIHRSSMMITPLNKVPSTSNEININTNAQKAPKVSSVLVNKVRRNSTAANVITKRRSSTVGKRNSVHVRLRANSVGIQSAV